MKNKTLPSLYLIFCAALALLAAIAYDAAPRCAQAADRLQLFFERPAASAVTAGPLYAEVSGRLLIVTPLVSKIVCGDFSNEEPEWQAPMKSPPVKVAASFDRSGLLVLDSDGGLTLIEAASGRATPVGRGAAKFSDVFATSRGYVAVSSSAVFEIRNGSAVCSPLAGDQQIYAAGVLSDPDGSVRTAVATASGIFVFAAPAGGNFSQESSFKGDFSGARRVLPFYPDEPSASERKAFLAVTFPDKVSFYDCRAPQAALKKEVALACLDSHPAGFLGFDGTALLYFCEKNRIVCLEAKGFAQKWEKTVQPSERHTPTVIADRAANFAAVLCQSAAGEVSVFDATTGSEIGKYRQKEKIANAGRIELAVKNGAPGLYALLSLSDSVRCLKLDSPAASGIYPAAAPFSSTTVAAAAPAPSKTPAGEAPVNADNLKKIWERHGTNITYAAAAILALFVLIRLLGRRKRKPGAGGETITAAEAEAQGGRLKAMLENAPENVEIIINLVALLKRQGARDEAAEYYKTLIKLRPAEDVYYEELLDMRLPYFPFVQELVALYRRKGKTKNVIPEYEKRIERSTQDGGKLDAPAARILARLLVDEKKAKDAVPVLERLNSAEPNSLEDMTLLAECLASAGELEKAADAYKAVIALDRSNNVVNHYVKLFQIFHKLTLNEEAVETFRIAMETKSAALDALLPHILEYFNESTRHGNKKVILMYGDCIIDAYGRQKNVVAAIGLIDKVLAIYPKEKNLIKRKAFLQLERGEEAGLFEMFKELYEANRNDLKIKIEYCRLLYKSGAEDECAALIVDALKKNESPDKFTEIYSSMAGDQIKAGKQARVIETLPQIYRMVNSNNLLAVLGEAYLKNGDLAKAHEIYSRVAGAEGAAEPHRKRLKYVKNLVDELNLAAMKAGKTGAGGDSVTLIIDGENVSVRLPEAPTGQGGGPDPFEIKMAEAKLFFEKGEYKKAIPLFQEAARMTEGKLGGLLVRIYLITCFLNEKMAPAAEKVYDSVDAAAFGAAEKDATAFKYRAAVLFEEKGSYEKAEAIYSDIAATDMGYRDVGDRMERVKKMMAAAAAARSEAQSDDSEKTTIATVASEVDYIDKRYEVINKIGKGGMGIVFRARDGAEKREVAIKIPILTYKDDRGFMDRFEREAAVLSKLKHPNIMHIFSVEGKELPYIVMEILDGKSLKDIIKEKKTMTPQETRDIAVQCCDALDYTHKLKIVHRDIKPENIMIIKNNVVKLMDFGLAKALDESTVTKAGTILGTFAYISPEQCTGSDVDGRADIYSLGVMFYEMLAGEKPFTSGDYVHQHLKVKPVPPTRKNSRIPYQVEAIVMKCLEKSPADRFQSAPELRAAWEKIV